MGLEAKNSGAKSSPDRTHLLSALFLEWILKSLTEWGDFVFASGRGDRIGRPEVNKTELVFAPADALPVPQLWEAWQNRFSQ